MVGRMERLEIHNDAPTWDDESMEGAKEHVRIVMRELRIPTHRYSVIFTSDRTYPVSIIVLPYTTIFTDTPRYYGVRVSSLALRHGDLSAQIRAAWCAFLLAQ